MRLSCLAHAGAWRAALRAHREGEEDAAELLGARWGVARGASRAPRGGAGAVPSPVSARSALAPGRAEGMSVACSAPKRAKSLGRSDHDQRMTGEANES